MKYLLTVLISIVLFNFSFGQISIPQKESPSTIVGKIAPLGSFTAELSYQKNEADEKDTTYSLRFRNAKYKQITSIETVRFSGIGNAVEDLYKAFKSVFLDENKNNKEYIIHFTLGKDQVAISNFRMIGINSAMFLYKEGDYFTLTEKQIDKLFGK